MLNIITQFLKFYNCLCIIKFEFVLTICYSSLICTQEEQDDTVELIDCTCKYMVVLFMIS